MATSSKATGRSTGRSPFLGVGWPFPIRPVRGRIPWSGYEEHIEQSIGLILETARRERRMLPEFGAGLRGFVFSPNTPATQRAVEAEVERALSDWEPRITVERVTARPGQDEPNLLLIEIDYVVRRTNASYNRVFPFYLTEGV